MKKRFLLAIIAAAVLFAGCSTENQAQAPDVTEETSQTTESTTTEAATTTQAAAPVKKLVLPVLENTSGKVQIQTVADPNGGYPYNSYMITSANGEIVVVDPTSMPRKSIIDIEPAAIVSTHDHSDHTDPKFTDKRECQKMLYVVDDINTEDFHIYSIATSHSGDEFDENSKNIIVVFEVDGLRIAHFGDCGQTALTDEQLEKIGKIDIAFMQFENSFSNVDTINKKGFNIMEQVNPTIVIPTHCGMTGFNVINSTYGGLTEVENILEISKEDLPEDALHFYQITNKHKYD